MSYRQETFDAPKEYLCFAPIDLHMSSILMYYSNCKPIQVEPQKSRGMVQTGLGFEEWSMKNSV
jgi:hypothetical protein